MTAVKICMRRSVGEALERMDSAQSQVITVYESRDVVAGVLLRAEAARHEPNRPVGDITRRLTRYADEFSAA